MGHELYVITDPVIGRERSHEEIARLAIEGGADAIQLRDKRRSARELMQHREKGLSWSAISRVMDIPYNTLLAAKARRTEKELV